MLIGNQLVARALGDAPQLTAEATRVARTTIDEAAGDAARLTAPGPSVAGSDAGRGAALIRILADENDSDGLGMIRALRARGADAEIWSLDHLRIAPDATMMYRGQAVAAPELAIPYHVHLEDSGLQQLQQLEELGVDLLTSPSGVAAARDKGITARLLEGADVPHPKTIEIRFPHEAEAAVEALWQDGIPLFLKNPVGTQGIGVAGLRSRSEAISVAQLVTAMPHDAAAGRRLLLQSGIELPPGEPLSDTRFFVVGDRVVAAMKRVQHTPGELRTGLHSGGVGVPYDASPEEQAMAVRAAHALGLRGVAGVDVVGGHVLEVNYGPGHRIGAITGTDVAGIIADESLARVAARRAADANT